MGRIARAAGSVPIKGGSTDARCMGTGLCIGDGLGNRVGRGTGTGSGIGTNPGIVLFVLFANN